MSSYWPRELSLDDAATPLQILEEAEIDWFNSSGGLIALVVQVFLDEVEQVQETIVHAKHSPTNRTSTLLSVKHRPDNPYPVRIYPRGDDIPDSLKKTYRKSNFASLAAAVGGGISPEGKTVKNPWVADTPAEFRVQLAKALSLGEVKSAIVNLTAATAEAIDPEHRAIEGDDSAESTE